MIRLIFSLSMSWSVSNQTREVNNSIKIKILVENLLALISKIKWKIIPPASVPLCESNFKYNSLFPKIYSSCFCKSLTRPKKEVSFISSSAAATLRLLPARSEMAMALKVKREMKKEKGREAAEASTAKPTGPSTST